MGVPPHLLTDGRTASEIVTFTTMPDLGGVTAAPINSRNLDMVSAAGTPSIGSRDSGITKKALSTKNLTV